jgi:hypothetical protein
MELFLPNGRVFGAALTPPCRIDRAPAGLNGVPETANHAAHGRIFTSSS